MSNDLRKRLIDLPDKNSTLYKLMDRFLTDDQKEDLIVTLLINGLWIAYHVPIMRDFIREGALEEGKMFKCITDKHVCYVAFDKHHKTLEILYKRKKLLSHWRELSLPEELSKMLHPDMNKRDFKRVMNTIMNMKAFW